MRIFWTLALWFLAWLLWSGIYKPLLIVLGLVSCLLVLVLSRRMGFFDKGVYSLHLIWRLLPFWGWLGKELVVSNLQVARIVLNPKLPISPTVTEAFRNGPGANLVRLLGSSGPLGRTWQVGTTAMWISILLTTYVLLYYL